MKFSIGVAMTPLDQLRDIAVAAEKFGFSSVALPDSLFYMETAAAEYPYTPDGVRMWTAESPWVDPFVAAAAMASVTTTLRFYTQVLKLGSRHPLLLARQLGSVAAMTDGRFGFGVGIGWAPEEFEWCGQPYARRGARVDEMLEVLDLVLGGGMVEHHGTFYDFDMLQMSPAPASRIPIYVGGHTGSALKRAARVGDGWTSAMMSFDDLTAAITRLRELRAEYGRADTPFEIQAVCIDRFGRSGYSELSDAGVTDAIVVPWIFDGLGFDSPVADKIASMAAFAGKYVATDLTSAR
ncbi:MAG: TIGR03619 family F420-dependent LLM class oxidoreductase [Rhodococcus sp. (in: high G+C Gram-positive bacteria)]